MTLYKENPKDSKSKLIDLINEFSEVARYKINIQKVFTIHYTNNEILEREYILKLTPQKKKERKKPWNKPNQRGERHMLRTIKP